MSYELVIVTLWVSELTIFLQKKITPWLPPKYGPGCRVSLGGFKEFA